MRDGAAEIAIADQSDIPLPVELEEPGDGLAEKFRIVALALLAEAPEIREVPANLGRGDADGIGQRLGRNRRMPRADRSRSART